MFSLTSVAAQISLKRDAKKNVKKLKYFKVLIQRKEKGMNQRQEGNKDDDSNIKSARWSTNSSENLGKLRGENFILVS